MASGICGAPKPQGFGTLTEESFALPVKGLLREVHATEEGLEAFGDVACVASQSA